MSYCHFPLEAMLQMFAPVPQPELIVCDRRAAVVERMQGVVREMKTFIRKRYRHPLHSGITWTREFQDNRDLYSCEQQGFK